MKRTKSVQTRKTKDQSFESQTLDETVLVGEIETQAFSKMSAHQLVPTCEPQMVVPMEQTNKKKSKQQTKTPSPNRVQTRNQKNLQLQLQQQQEQMQQEQLQQQQQLLKIQQQQQLMQQQFLQAQFHNHMLNQNLIPNFENHNQIQNQNQIQVQNQIQPQNQKEKQKIQKQKQKVLDIQPQISFHDETSKQHNIHQDQDQDEDEMEEQFDEEMSDLTSPQKTPSKEKRVKKNVQSPPSKKIKAEKTWMTYWECSTCGGTDDKESLLICKSCKTSNHLQCLTYIPDDDFKYINDWICEDCVPDKGLIFKDPNGHKSSVKNLPKSKKIKKIIRVRYQSSDKAVQFLVSYDSGEFAWVKRESLHSNMKLFQEFLMSSDFENLIKSRNILPNIYAEEIRTQMGFTKLVYRFASNNAYFGVRQYLGVLSESLIQSLESGINTVYEMGTNDQLMKSTTNVTAHDKRSKFFFGYGYVDYQYGKRPMLIDDVDPIPPFIRELVNRIEEVGISEKGFIDQAVINLYHQSGSGLGVHIDPIDLFERPILSIRLFSDCTLSFGCRGLGMVLRKQAVPLPRGSITLMEHYAANKIKHCVRPSDVKTKSASILLRKVTEKSKAEMMLRKQATHPQKILTSPSTVESGSTASSDDPVSPPNLVPTGTVLFVEEPHH